MLVNRRAIKYKGTVLDAKESCGNDDRETFNQEVMGSNPIALTNEIKELEELGNCIASRESRLGSIWEAARGFTGDIGIRTSCWWR
jgi:hypothetical protein